MLNLPCSLLSFSACAQFWRLGDFQLGSTTATSLSTHRPNKLPDSTQVIAFTWKNWFYPCSAIIVYHSLLKVWAHIFCCCRHWQLEFQWNIYICNVGVNSTKTVSERREKGERARVREKEKGDRETERDIETGGIPVDKRFSFSLLVTKLPLPAICSLNAKQTRKWRKCSSVICKFHCCTTLNQTLQTPLLQRTLLSVQQTAGTLSPSLRSSNNKSWVAVAVLVEAVVEVELQGHLRHQEARWDPLVSNFLSRVRTALWTLLEKVYCLLVVFCGSYSNGLLPSLGSGGNKDSAATPRGTKQEQPALKLKIDVRLSVQEFF